MVKNALLLTTLLLMAFFFAMLHQVSYLLAYKAQLVEPAYRVRLALYVALLAVNVFALIFSLERQFFLKDAGRKLVHVEKQFQTDHDHLTTEMSTKSKEEG